MPFKTLVVDDEPLARVRLIHLLEKYKNDFEIVGQAVDGDEALQKIQQQEIEVIFLDIQMPGKTGLELLEELEDPPIIIFTTAYDQYALKAFEENAIDYLLKPIERERLGKAIDKLKRLTINQKSELQDQIKNLLLTIQQPHTNRFPVKIGDRVIFIGYEEICFFQAMDKVVVLHTYDNKYICDESLSTLERDLPKDIFMRVHRSVLVNINHIKEARRSFPGKYMVLMKDKQGTELPLSRTQKGRLGF